jgi:hypothetical protein
MQVQPRQIYRMATFITPFLLKRCHDEKKHCMICLYTHNPWRFFFSAENVANGWGFFVGRGGAAITKIHCMIYLYITYPCRVFCIYLFIYLFILFCFSAEYVAAGCEHGGVCGAGWPPLCGVDETREGGTH